VDPTDVTDAKEPAPEKSSGLSAVRIFVGVFALALG